MTTTDADKGFRFRVGDEQHSWPERCILGREVLRIVGKDPAEFDVYQLFADRHGERIDLNEQADLMASGVERFDVVAKTASVLRFTVDNEPMIIRDAKQKVRAIIGFSGNAPIEDYFLLEVSGCHDPKRHDDLETEIDIQSNHQFAVAHRGCTPVSFTSGSRAFADSFLALHRRIDTVDADRSWCVIPDFVVPSGRFAGNEVRVAFDPPGDFPVVPPGGFYVSPAIVPPDQMGAISVHHRANETAGLEGEWQYWSRPIPPGTWRHDDPARRLVSHLNAVFANVN